MLVRHLPACVLNTEREPWREIMMEITPKKSNPILKPYCAGEEAQTFLLNQKA
jgi:hypothetical protein